MSDCPPVGLSDSELTPSTPSRVETLETRDKANFKVILTSPADHFRQAVKISLFFFYFLSYFFIVIKSQKF